MSSDYRNFASDKVIVMSAPNGARRGHADHPKLPVTPQESADDAVALRDAGVSVLHLHVRDDYGQHSLDPDRYRQAIAAIENSVGNDLVIQVTTEAAGRYSSEQQMDVVRDLKPEAVSIGLREIIPLGSDERVAATFFTWMRSENIWPQYILYSSEDVLRFNDMLQRGIFSDSTPFAMFVLGDYAEADAGSVAELHRLLSVTDPSAFPWASCCFGSHENDAMLAAAALGGHVRLGFENNLHLSGGDIAPDNAALIRRFTADNANSKRRPTSAAEVRETFFNNR